MKPVQTEKNPTPRQHASETPNAGSKKSLIRSALDVVKTVG
jgi:hypothetical protein